MVKSIYSKKHGEHKLYFSSEDIDIVNSYEWVPKKDNSQRLHRGRTTNVARKINDLGLLKTEVQYK